VKTEIGEYVVGAYLKIIEKYDFVEYNVRTPGGGLKGLNELDVVGLRFKDQTAALCEVTTHIRGFLYQDGSRGVDRVARKHGVQIAYAKEYLKVFPNIHYQFWSPRVPVGPVCSGLAEINGLELIINDEYTRRIEQLRNEAAKHAHDAGNPFFRTLQILEHLRR